MKENIMALLKIALFSTLLSPLAQLSSAQDSPGRGETLAYINTLLSKMNGVKAWEVDVPDVGIVRGGTFGDKSRPFSYDATTEAYQFRRTVNFDSFKVDRISGQVTRYTTIRNLPIKAITRIEFKEGDFPGVGNLVLYFSEPFSIDSRLTIKRSDVYNPQKFGESQSTHEWLGILFPDGDPNNFKRLKNAFLRLKEIESEAVDPFE